MADELTVLKLDHEGREVFRYTVGLVERGEDWVKVEARFARDAVDIGPAVFERGDRFVEWFYSSRWYNIFEVRAAADGHLKGWYCNITRPARLDGDTIMADDLALDLWVDNAGQVTMLDVDEFEEIPLSTADRAAALAAVETLRRAVEKRTPPFAVVS